MSTTDPARTPPGAGFSSNDRLWSVLCHLSYFFGFAVLAFLFPLCVYLVMRTDSPYVTHHAREALNFHLSLLIYFLASAVLLVVGVGFIGIIVLGLVGLICSIVAAVHASRGTYYSYPITIRFVR